MADVASELSKVWRAFRAVGINDDLAIIEHVAALLIAQKELPLPAEELRPRSPQLAAPDLESIRTILRDLSALPTPTGKLGAAELFDRYVVFRLPESLPGERYPTPRHIVRFMHNIATVGAQESLLDLACGSGGMLALRAQTTGDQARTVGREISPAWARLAWANCALHGLVGAHITIEDALAGDAAGVAETFSRVLMNPPFGARAAPQGQRAGRSETALAQRALALLTDAGRLCTLAPAGVLFGGGLEKQLRQRLVDDRQLDAVVALPKDAFQPYSALQTYLLLVTKTAPQANAATWFLRGERDGYPSGRGRDLTKGADDNISDLPLIEATLAWDGIWYNSADQGPLRYQRLTQGAVVIGVAEPAVFTRIERYDVGSKHLLLATTRNGTQVTTQIIDALSGGPELLSGDREATLKQKFGLKKEERLPEVVLLLQEGNQGSAIVVAIDGRLIGTQVSRQALHQTDYDLRVERYVRAEVLRATARPPGELLVDIRANQQRLNRRIDGLLGRLEAPRVGDGALVAPVWTAPADLPMIELLSREQHTVWNAVASVTLQIQLSPPSPDDQQAIIETPDYFTVETLRQNGLAVPDAEIEKTLDLFEQMGLIVFANLPGATEQRLPVYRLVSERDKWNSSPATNAETTS